MTPSASSDLISVVVPLYQSLPHILETLAALRAQTHTNWEAILVDDGSPSPQEPRIRAACDDPRLRFLRQERAGPGRARAAGLALARGELIQLCDQDDLISPDKLALQAAFLREHPEVDLTWTDWCFFYVDEQGVEHTRPRSDFYSTPPEGDVFPLLVRHNFLANEAVLFRRRLLEGVELVDLPGNLTTNDWHFWLQLLEGGAEVAYAPRGEARKRIHPGCTSLDWEAAIEGRRRVYAWLSERLGDRARPPGRGLAPGRSAPSLSAAERAAMEVEWSKDAALLGRRREALSVLARALGRAPLTPLVHPQRCALTLLLGVPGLRSLLLRVRERRDPYLRETSASSPGAP